MQTNANSEFPDTFSPDFSRFFDIQNEGKESMKICDSESVKINKSH